jgi:hypothetical protein
MMYQNDINEYGCPLRDQSGSVGVQNFDLIIGLLAPELRAAFEAERAACQAELELYLAANLSAEAASADASAGHEPDSIAECAPAPTSRALLGKLEQWLGKRGRPRLRGLIDGLRPRVVAQ